MNYLIGIGLLVALCAGSVEAQDGDRAQRLKEIKQLEARAERLLEAGRRPEAFDALARAAVLRDALKKSGKPAPKAKAKAKTEPKPARTRSSDFQKASAALTKALNGQDMRALHIAAMRFQAVAMAAEKRQRQQREQLTAERRKRMRLEQRLTELEQQLMALKKLMDG